MNPCGFKSCIQSGMKTLIIRKTKCSRLPKRSVPFGKTKRTSNHHFKKNFDPASPGVSMPPGSAFERPSNIVRRPFFSLYALGRFATALGLRYLVQRFIRCHALRFDEISAEGQTRADIRDRTRSIVMRIRERHAAIRTRVVAAAIDHTA